MEPMARKPIAKSNSCPINNPREKLKEQKDIAKKGLIPRLFTSRKILSEEKRPKAIPVHNANLAPSPKPIHRYNSLPQAPAASNFDLKWKQQFPAFSVPFDFTTSRDKLLQSVKVYCDYLEAPCIPMDPTFQMDREAYLELNGFSFSDDPFLKEIKSLIVAMSNQFTLFFENQGMRTKESDAFQQHLKSLNAASDYENFIRLLKCFDKDELGNFFVFLKYFQTSRGLLYSKLEEEYCRFVPLFKQVVEQVQIVQSFANSIICEESVWTDKFKVETITNPNQEQVIRSYECEGQAILTDLKINNHRVKQEKDMTYLASVIYLIRKEKFEEKIDKETAGLQAIRYRGNKEISGDVILKLGSHRNWAQANDLIRKKKARLFDPPYTTRAKKDSTKCRVKIKSKEDFDVTLYKTYTTFRRLKNEADCFTYHDEPIGETTFRWTVRYSGGKYQPTLTLKHWKVNEKADLKDQLEFVTILIEHLKGYSHPQKQD